MTKIKLKPTKPFANTSDNLRYYAEQLSESTEYNYAVGLCFQAADELDVLHKVLGEMDDIIMQLERRLDEQENFGQHD